MAEPNSFRNFAAWLVTPIPMQGDPERRELQNPGVGRRDAVPTARAPNREYGENPLQYPLLL